MSSPRVSYRKYTFKDLHSEKIQARKPIFAFFPFFPFFRCDEPGRSVIRSSLVPWEQFYALRLRLVFFKIRTLNQELFFPPSISLYLPPSHIHILFFQSTINSLPRWLIWPRNIIWKVIELSSLGHRSGYVADSAVIADRFLIPGHWAHATRLSHPFLPEHTGLSRSS